MSFYAHALPSHWRTNRWFNVYVTLVALTVIAEMAWLIFAAAIGEPSHFNQSHPILRPVYPLMGLFAIMLTSLSALFGVGILKHTQSAMPAGLRLAIAYSLIATAILTIMTAGYMSSAPAQAHAVLPEGVIPSQNALPIVGWLRDVGDLRVAHFFATHALHFVPLVALIALWLAPQQLPTSAKSAHLAPVLLTGAYSAFVIAVFAQAIAGKPFF